MTLDTWYYETRDSAYFIVQLPEGDFAVLEQLIIYPDFDVAEREVLQDVPGRSQRRPPWKFWEESDTPPQPRTQRRPR